MLENKSEEEVQNMLKKRETETVAECKRNFSLHHRYVALID